MEEEVGVSLLGVLKTFFLFFKDEKAGEPNLEDAPNTNGFLEFETFWDIIGILELDLSVSIEWMEDFESSGPSLEIFNFFNGGAGLSSSLAALPDLLNSVLWELSLEDADEGVL